jgi:hypothetical protein
MSLVTLSIISMVMVCTWAAQLRFWFLCECAFFTPKWCPTSTDPRNVGSAKPLIGVFAAVMFGIVFGLSAVAAWKERKERKRQSLLLSYAVATTQNMNMNQTLELDRKPSKNGVAVSFKL